MRVKIILNGVLSKHLERSDDGLFKDTLLSRHSSGNTGESRMTGQSATQPRLEQGTSPIQI
jgi:hypothetical protein